MGLNDKKNEETQNTSNKKNENASVKIGNVTTKSLKLKVRIPDGVQIRNPQTGEFFKDEKKNKERKSMDVEVPNDLFWQRRISNGDVEWLDCPKEYKFQPTHRLASR